MTSFDNREQAFEAKFAHDQDLRFKVFARRDKLFGLWIAEKLGKTGPAAEEYAKSVVVADLDEAGDEDVIRKVSADLSAAGITLSKDEIVKTLAQFLEQAADQFKS